MKTYRPPFHITNQIMQLVAKIEFFLGTMQASGNSKVPIKLRKDNQIKTIHHSLAIEGNTLSTAQITALVQGKKIVGLRNQILEVQNAIDVYDKISLFKSYSENDFLKAHKSLLSQLVQQAGSYRKTSVGVLKGTHISHVATQAKFIPEQMKNLFLFVKNDKETHPIIKACVFHYELEFIHPFTDGNGRMGRLWQQVILKDYSNIFEFISVETAIHDSQKKYYQVLETCDKKGDSTDFIEFSLNIILKTLSDFSDVYKPVRPTTEQRLHMAIEEFASGWFGRQDYMKIHKTISTAQASRDLKTGIENRLLIKKGDKALALYKKK